MLKKSPQNSTFLHESISSNAAALALLIDCNNLVESDSIALRKGALIPAQYEFKIKFFSNFSENEFLHSEVDLITIASNAILNLSQISTRKLDPMQLAHVSFVDIKTESLISGKQVFVNGVVNALNDDAGEKLQTNMASSLDAITKSNSCNFEFTFEERHPAFKNDVDYCRFLHERGIEVLGKTKVLNMEFLNKNYDRYRALFQNNPSVILHIGSLDHLNSPNPLSPLDLEEIDKVSLTATKLICWSLLRI